MSTTSPRQLLLGIKLDEDATFANFFIGSQNQTLVNYLQNLQAIDTPRQVLLWGSPASGRTHLLQAICHRAQAEGENYFYLPLSEKQQLAPQILEGLEALTLVCIDDLSCIAGDASWERALFSFYQRAREADTLVVAAADAPPAQTDFQLADLVSRLQWSTVFHLQDLDDQGKLELLRLRALRLGIDLESQVAGYILQHSSRNVKSLLDVLLRLDAQSLEARRPITIPLVKSVMEW